MPPHIARRLPPEWPYLAVAVTPTVHAGCMQVLDEVRQAIEQRDYSGALVMIEQALAATLCREA